MPKDALKMMQNDPLYSKKRSLSTAPITIDAHIMQQLRPRQEIGWTKI